MSQFSNWECRPEDYAFVRNSGLRHSDFAPDRRNIMRRRVYAVIAFVAAVLALVAIAAGSNA